MVLETGSSVQIKSLDFPLTYQDAANSVTVWDVTSTEPDTVFELKFILFEVSSFQMN